MTNKISLSVTSTDDENSSGNSSSATMNFDSLSELARLLQMAGVKSNDNASSDDIEDLDTNVIPDEEYCPSDNGMSGPIDLDVGQDGSITMATDENADYDYRLNPTSRKGFVYNVDPYAYEGDAELDTRDVPARSGDNPLRKIGTHRTFESYLKLVEEKKEKRAPEAIREKAFSNGEGAYINSESKSKNPHKKGTDLHICWNNGYDSAEHEDFRNK